jgi:hypothetical protein
LLSGISGKLLSINEFSFLYVEVGLHRVLRIQGGLVKNALTIASEKLCKPSKWNPADKPEMLLLLYCIF